MRIYGQSAVNPKGTREDLTRCVEEVSDAGGWHWYQCQRKRGHGPAGEYCKQHAKRIESRRQTQGWMGVIAKQNGE